jgi:hypothetical protein
LPVAGDDSDPGQEPDSDEEQQQRGKRVKKQLPAQPSRERRRAAGQVDYRLLHEQLFGFAAFEGAEDIFRENDDEDFDSDQHVADSDDD